ncbi:MAG TPA: hypothetical protein VJV05_14490 [Pyrinomonadaceae bacterium]|nr:hypothetical protein [Pyrinomonadaceae bacterium]
MKLFYGAAWFLLAFAVIVALFTGSFDSSALVVSSMIALGLVYALALWAVSGRTRGVEG